MERTADYCTSVGRALVTTLGDEKLAKRGGNRTGASFAQIGLQLADFGVKQTVCERVVRE